MRSATASTRRRSPSGSRGPRFPICRQDRRSPDRRSCQVRREAVVVAFRRHICSADDCVSDIRIDALVPRQVATHGSPGRASRRRSVEIQGLSDRLFSYRHRRGSNRAGQALSSSSPSTERRSSPSSSSTRRSRRRGPDFPPPADRGRPLQGPHRPHRQRNPLHHPGDRPADRNGPERKPFGRTPSNTPALRTTSIIG